MLIFPILDKVNIINFSATKALILIAMAVCNRQVETYEYKVRTEEFINRLKMNTGKIGAYTLGLIIQVNALI